MRDLEVNPLVQACADISRSGLKNNQDLNPRFSNPRLTSLGNYLLNVECEQKFALRHRDLGYKGHYRDDEVAIVFRPTTLCYLTLIEALRREWQVYLVHINLGQASYGIASKVFNTLRSGWLCAMNQQKDQYAENPFRIDFSKIKKAVNTQVEFIERVHFIEETLSIGDGIPAANLLEAAIASIHAPRIWFPVPKLNTKKIMGGKFLRNSSVIFSEFYGYDVLVESPIIRHREKSLLAEHFQKGFDYGSLQALFDCDQSTGDSAGAYLSHCGSCYSCVKKYFVLQGLNIEFDFKVHPQSTPDFARHAERYKAENEGIYQPGSSAGSVEEGLADGLG